MGEKTLSEELWDADLMKRQIRDYLGTNRRAAHWLSGFDRGVEWLRNHIGSRLVDLEAENARLRKVYEAANKALPCVLEEGDLVWCASCGIINPREGDEHEEDCSIADFQDAVRELRDA